MLHRGPPDGAASPGRSQAQGELPGFGISRPGKGKNLPPFMERYLGDDMQFGAADASGPHPDAQLPTTGESQAAEGRQGSPGPSPASKGKEHIRLFSTDVEAKDWTRKKASTMREASKTMQWIEQQDAG